MMKTNALALMIPTFSTIMASLSSAARGGGLRIPKCAMSSCVGIRRIGADSYCSAAAGAINRLGGRMESALLMQSRIA